MSCDNKLLLGLKINNIAACQFWFEGGLSSPCSPIFIMDEYDSCWNMSLNDENHEWEISFERVAFPEIGSIILGDDMEWRNVGVENSNKLVGQKITTFKKYFFEDKSCAVLKCENGWGILAAHYFTLETDVFQISKTFDSPNIDWPIG